MLGEVGAPLNWVLAAARFLLAVVVLVVLFAFVYWIGPNRDHPSWVWISPGALFGVLGGWSSPAGSRSTRRPRGRTSKTYGAIAGVAILLIWLQISMMVILSARSSMPRSSGRAQCTCAVAEGAGFAAPEASAEHIERPPDAPSDTKPRQERTP